MTSHYVLKHCQIGIFADDTSLFIAVDYRVTMAEHLEVDSRVIVLRGWALGKAVTLNI